jgi:ubiquinone/menaquinone biosynthesis C-methylase UbiE
MSSVTFNPAQRRLRTLLEPFTADSDGIYRAAMPDDTSGQSGERLARQRVAERQYDNYLAEIARNHSIPVMDHEVDNFLGRLPEGAVILDIGGCWGWHWRRLAARPDVAVLIIDFVHSNLLHARRVLGELVGSQIALMSADATALPFPELGFDGVWTVQVFQHIPDYALACREARRVLMIGGQFVSYSLHVTPLNRFIRRVLGKPLHVQGMLPGAGYQLNRANDRQRDTVAEVFRSPVVERYTECLFHPDFRMTRSGRPGSALGRLDNSLSELSWVARWIARQRSFAAVKR